MSGIGVHELYRQGRRAASWGLAVSLLLAVAKLAGGWFGHSVALLVDAIHSFGDALLSGVVWAALHWSQQPPDREHPYGHTRAEAVAALSISLLLALSSLAAGWQSLQALLAPWPQTPAALTLAVAAGSFALNEALYQYNSRVAQGTGSRALQATAWDQRLDALTSLVILAALLLDRWGGPSWRAADPLAGLAVSAVILAVGCRLFRSTVDELMDAQAEPRVVELVRREALGVAGVRGVEKLLVRKTGIEFLVDIHLEVDPEATVRAGHAVGHAVKDHLMRMLPPIKGVLVHIEPAPGPHDTPRAEGDRS
jgi:cation diffusion facilitator family transporter